MNCKMPFGWVILKEYGSATVLPDYSALFRTLHTLFKLEIYTLMNHILTIIDIMST